MPLTPLSESDSPLHTVGDTYINPFEISSDIPTDPNTIIEPDDVDLSSPFARTSSNKPRSSPKSTTININSPSVTGSIGHIPRRFATDTLDEPVAETILRDLRNIALKLRQVLYPKGNQDVLRDWDLWGPLILCLTLALLLSFNAEEVFEGDQKVSVFTGVFVIVWCGAVVVTVNAKLLGGTM
ncbi:1270_t:CDS:2 [Dentiscutata erythropus]|uniref:1270_t:CDS:1 n=1 Tax=Dentiscutata erythropus TaxID=1348616 RepID=A0A9N8VQT1_9GLOM|nr:1270_t:CDS:2 [Dentiscutata erythropus]